MNDPALLMREEWQLQARCVEVTGDGIQEHKSNSVSIFTQLSNTGLTIGVIRAVNHGRASIN